MKKQLKWIIPVVALVVLLFAAGGIYRALGQKYKPALPPAHPDSANTVAVDGDFPLELVTDEPQDAVAFSVADADGREVRLSDKQGKPVVINFWATWCPYCVEELPAFEQMYAEYGDQIDFMMIDLTDGMRETTEAAAAYIDQNGFTFPVYFDTQQQAADAFAVSSVPLTVFLHPDGSVADSHLGAMDASTLQAYLDTLIA